MTSATVTIQSRYGSAADATSNGLSFAIVKKTQSLTFARPTDKTIGDPVFALTATASSGLPVAFLSDTQSVCTVTDTTVSLNSIGTCTIRAIQAGDSTFASGESSWSFTVIPKLIYVGAVRNGAP